MSAYTAWRFTVFGRPMAPWRETCHGALLDAVDAGYGTVDEHNDRLIWLTVPGEIETTTADVEVQRRPEIGPTSTDRTYRPDRGSDRHIA